MPISITCSGCSADFEVPNNLAGKTIRCTSCKTQVSVPASNGAAKKAAVKSDVVVDDDDDDNENDRKKSNPNRSSGKPVSKVAGKRRQDDDDDDEDDQDDRPAKKKKKKQPQGGGSGPMIAIIAVAVLALAGIAGGAIYFLTGDDKKKDSASSSSSDSKPSSSSGSSSSSKDGNGRNTPGSPKAPPSLPGAIPPGGGGGGHANAGPGSPGPGNPGLGSPGMGGGSASNPTVTTTSLPDGWYAFSADGFAVEVPGKPSLKAETKQTAIGAIKVNTYSVGDTTKHEFFTVTSGVLPVAVNTPEQIEGAFAGGLAAMEQHLASLSTGGSKVSFGSKTDLKQDGFPAKEVQLVETPDHGGGGTLRVVLARNRMYVFLACADKFAPFQDQAKRFFSTIKISEYGGDGNNVASGGPNAPGRTPGPGGGPPRPPGGGLQPPTPGGGLQPPTPGGGLQPPPPGGGLQPPPPGGGLQPPPPGGGLQPPPPGGGLQPPQPGGGLPGGGLQPPQPGGGLPGGGLQPPQPGGPGQPPRPGGGGPGRGPGPGMPGGGPGMPGGGPGVPGGGPGMPGGIGAKSDPYAPPQGVVSDGNPPVRTIDSFWTAAFDTEHKIFYTVTSRPDKGKLLGLLIAYEYPEFKRKDGSFKMPHLATRAAIDSSKGLLYVATATSASIQGAIKDQQFDLASAVGDVQIFDLKSIETGGPNSELKLVATIPVNKPIRGLELSNDGKSLFVATTTSAKPITSSLLKIDTETRKVTSKSIDEPIWEMRKTADGNSLLVLFGIHGTTKTSSARTINLETLEKEKELRFEGVANHISSAPNSKKGRVAATVSKDTTNPAILDASGDDDTHDVQLGVGWRAANHGPTPGYVEYSPNGKMVFISAHRAAGLDVYELNDVDDYTGWKKKASIRSAGNNPVGGHFFVSPDGEFLIDHHGVVIKTSNVGGSNGEATATATGPGAPGAGPGVGPGAPGMPPVAGGPGNGPGAPGGPGRPRPPTPPGAPGAGPAPGAPGGGVPPPATAAPGGGPGAPGGGVPPPATAAPGGGVPPPAPGVPPKM